MKGKVFLVEWDKSSAERRAAEIRRDEWDVEIECEDSYEAFRKIKNNPPNVIVLDLSKRPTFSRQTALSLLDDKVTRGIPLIFVDGDDEDIETLHKYFPDAVFTTSMTLLHTLRRFTKKQNAEEKLKTLFRDKKEKLDSLFLGKVMNISLKWTIFVMLRLSFVYGFIWERQYGIEDRAEFMCGGIVKTDDEGFVLCGFTSPMNFPWWDIDGYIVRTNALGDTRWTRRVGDSLGSNPPRDYIWDVIVNNDNELVFVGTRFVPWTGVKAQVWFLKYDINGNCLMDKRIGGAEEDNGNEIIQNPDGTYMVLGDTRSFGTQVGGKDIWLLKLNSDGDTIWTKTYDFQHEDMGTGIIPWRNNMYLITAFSKTGNWLSPPADMGFATYFIIDSVGNILNIKTFDWDSLESFDYICRTNDSGAIIVGQTSINDNFPNRDIWILKLNADGDTMWTKTYGTYGRYDGGLCIFQTTDGGYYLSAYSQTYTTPEMDYDNWWILRLNDTGDTMWTWWWGSPLNDDPYSIIPSSDNGLIIAGWRDANSNPFSGLSLGNAEFYVIKADTGSITKTHDDNYSNAAVSKTTQIFPNPFNYSTTIKFSLNKPGYLVLRILDVNGREIATLLDGYFDAGEHSSVWNGKDRNKGHLPDGIYFYKLDFKYKTIETGKIFLIR